MKLNYIWIENYKNLRNCGIDFPETPQLLNAIIGGNGSGKSNLIEAVLHILIDVYFKKLPPFDFRFCFEAQRRQVLISGMNRKLSIQVDDEPKTIDHFAMRLRDGPAQVFYPELTFLYYSGECQRVRNLITRYQRHFQKLTLDPDTDNHRPLFVESRNEQSQTILLALFAHKKRDLLDRLGLLEVTDISLVLRSPQGFDPDQHEPKLWNTTGLVRKIVAAINDTAQSQTSSRTTNSQISSTGAEQPSLISTVYRDTRTYRFSDAQHKGHTIFDLADRLSKGGENLYQAFEHLRARGILCSVTYRINGVNRSSPFEFSHLSEGEKQLLAVIGAIQLTNQTDNLVLLDEPDTHLNPHWLWDYSEMLNDALCARSKDIRSTVMLTTHDPVMISGLTKEQVLLTQPLADNVTRFTHPRRNPRGQGIANLLCSSEFFGLPSSLDKETQKLLDERLAISIKSQLTQRDKERLKVLNNQLEILPGISERDPDYVAFLRQQYERRVT